jgi:hypothetical protein
MALGKFAYTVFFAGSFALLATGALAAETAKKRHEPLQKTIGKVTPTGPVPSLAVINSDGATLKDNKLVLTGVSTNSIVFADRPVRAAGHVTTAQFIMQWDEGKDNFAIDPPNATVSVLGGDGSDVSDAVVTLMKPKLEGTTLTFDVKVLEGSLAEASGPTALFIDNFGGGGGWNGNGNGGQLGGSEYTSGYASPGRSNYWHAPSLQGAWYGAAQ